MATANVFIALHKMLIAAKERHPGDFGLAAASDLAGSLSLDAECEQKINEKLIETAVSVGAAISVAYARPFH